MTESLTRADGSTTPVGTLANYSLTHTATPLDPRDGGGQIPTYTATITEPLTDPKRLVGTEVTLEDWTGTRSTGRVVASAHNAKSGLYSIDTNTTFERLNTEQTCLPIIYSETTNVDPVREALAHWMLMAGVPKERFEGYLLQYIDTEVINTCSYGYIADSISKYRWAGPPSTYDRFVPSADPETSPLEVNLSQSTTIGGRFYTNRTLSELSLDTTLAATGTSATFTIRRNGDTWTVMEKVGTTAELVLLTATWSPTNLSEQQHYCFLEIAANPNFPESAILTLRLMEKNSDGDPVYTDFTATVGTKLRSRPQPYRVNVGYPSALVGTHVIYGRPAAYFAMRTDHLPEKYPAPSYSINTGITYMDENWKAKMPFKVPGYTANVWDKMREFCSLLDIDISFEADIITFRPRLAKREEAGSNYFIPALELNKVGLTENYANREPAKSVEVNFREMLGDDSNFANTLLWKADSVYSLEKGELKEEIVQTKSTFVYLHNPVPVSGVPVPYTSAFSSYVVTGADGFIVSPAWWSENGGSIRVQTTKNSGEIKIIMQAPAVDTTRAPYRISEGVSDRPALYIKGYGMQMSEPTAVKVYTGADNATQEVGVTYDSIFVTKKLMAFNAGQKIAATYGNGSGTLKFAVNRSDYIASTAADSALTPLAECVYWGGSYYRIIDESTGPRGITVNNAERFNTIRIVNGEFATGKTIADWNALHAGKLIRDTNASPLPQYTS